MIFCYDFLLDILTMIVIFSRKFLSRCQAAVVLGQKYWRGRVVRRENYAIAMLLVKRRGLREISARTIQYAWMRCVTVTIHPFNAVALDAHQSSITCVGFSLRSLHYSSNSGNNSSHSGGNADGNADGNAALQPPSLTTMTLFAHKMYTRRLHWQCGKEASARGRFLPYVHDIQRVYRGHVGRKKNF